MAAGEGAAAPLLTVVVPALNEEEALPSTLHGLRAVCDPRGWKIVVVDDGSSDGTSQVARAAGVRVERHKVRRGYGGAIKTGISVAPAGLIATFDADGQHDPNDLVGLVQVLQDRDADMVTGLRQGVSAGPYRSLGKWIIRRITRVLLPVTVYDLNTGIRVFRAEMGLRYAPLLPDSPALCDVMTLLFIAEKHVVLEHPVAVRARAGGVSKMSTRTALDTVMEILNIVTLIHPLRIFLPLSVLAATFGVLWGIPYIWMGRGVSVGSMLAIVTGVILFTLGLLAEQLAAICRRQVSEVSGR
ncbi:MAG: glycosyltransferase family 2 protein [Longimicrobiales bacterium]|nr:glycosyltransferase family 2 protein [Longimicrobiales bacterium]